MTKRRDSKYIVVRDPDDMFDINDTIPTDTVPQEYMLSWQKLIYAAFRCDQHNDVPLPHLLSPHPPEPLPQFFHPSYQLVERKGVAIDE